MINSSIKLVTWSDNWTFAKKELNMCLQKRLSTARNTVWQIRLVQYTLLRWTKALQDQIKIRFWFKLCERHFQRYQYFNLDRQIRSIICINFVQLDRRTKIFMQFQSKIFDSIKCWCSWWISSTEQSKAQTNFKFLEIETNVRSKLNPIFNA